MRANVEQCAFVWICAACMHILVVESKAPKHSQIPWQRLSRCSRCQAQVPGGVSLGEIAIEESEPCVALWLCPQCCVTLERQIVRSRSLASANA